MLQKIDFKALVGAVVALGIGVLTVMGKVQQVINFADPLNEMIFAFVAFCFGGACLFGLKK